MSIALKATGVTTGYADAPILSEVSIDVAPGEIVGILGANGAGKTTLLRALAGTLPCWRGSVAVAGTDVTRLPPWRRVGLGLSHVLEGRHVFGPLTVAENLDAASLTGRATKALRDEVLALFPVLTERSRQRAGSLSGGEQQMLAIARALLCGPDVLMVDEMSDGLAPVITQELLTGLRRINAERRVALVLVEQSPHLIAEIVDRVYLLEHGRVAAQGTIEDVGGAGAIAELYLGVRS
ncbi:MAG: ABC transporter ATP-binding protein [Actinomycetota bacterium]